MASHPLDSSCQTSQWQRHIPSEVWQGMVMAGSSHARGIRWKWCKLDLLSGVPRQERQLLVLNTAAARLAAFMIKMEHHKSMHATNSNESMGPNERCGPRGNIYMLQVCANVASRNSIDDCLRSAQPDLMLASDCLPLAGRVTPLTVAGSSQL